MIGRAMTAACSVVLLCAAVSVLATPGPARGAVRAGAAETAEVTGGGPPEADVATAFTADLVSRAQPGSTASSATTGPDLSQLARRQRSELARVRRVTVAVTGDILLHMPVTQQAATSVGRYDFTPMLAPIAQQVSSADVALCHLEVPLSADGTDLSGYPIFNAPPQIATALAGAGYEGCSTASNHSLDKGARGVSETLNVLDAAALGHAGTARDANEDAAPVLYPTAGLVIGHVSATYGLNGFELPADQPWLADLADPIGDVLTEAAATRAAGADVVVVSVHWGEEYRTAPTAYQRAVADLLLASPDVDLVVGHHAHVVQPIERVGDKAVVYGLGNLLSGQGGRHTPGTQDGVIVTIGLDVATTGDVAVADITYIPTWVEPGTYRVLPVPQTLTDPSLSADRRAALGASLARTQAAIGIQARLG